MWTQGMKTLQTKTTADILALCSSFLNASQTEILKDLALKRTLMESGCHWVGNVRAGKPSWLTWFSAWQS